MARRVGGETFALVLAVVVIGVGMFLDRQDDSSGATPTGAAALASGTDGTPTEATALPTSSPMVTPISTGASTPALTATPDVLAGAKLRTSDEAVAFALDYARGLGAQNPRLVSVELLEIDAAIGRVDAQSGGVPGDAGWSADGPAGWAWLVQFDNGEFGIPSCEPPYDPTPWPTDGGGHSCGTMPTAILVIRASDALVVATALGPTVPL